jgi:hypothetical protein
MNFEKTLDKCLFLVYTIYKINDTANAETKERKMTNLTITSQESGIYTSYMFTSRKIEYQIITKGNGTYDIHTKRSHMSHFSPPKVMTLKQMEEANNTLKSFVNWLLRG